jgi:hypothetical protein
MFVDGTPRAVVPFVTRINLAVPCSSGLRRHRAPHSTAAQATMNEARIEAAK